ncbi:hypothetical protein SDC9_156379 [bioreactor metagenome]|uniref:Uncharacterized protein n=1 Tax=bioreactor metagenome TaxID=1076179 RepID=A0A645F497_9ZZZZ
MLWNPAQIAFPGGPGAFGVITEEGESLQVEWLPESGGVIRLRLTPEAMEITFPEENAFLRYSGCREAMEKGGTRLRYENGGLCFSRNGLEAVLNAEPGSIVAEGADFLLRATGTRLRLTVNPVRPGF